MNFTVYHFTINQTLCSLYQIISKKVHCNKQAQNGFPALVLSTSGSYPSPTTEVKTDILFDIYTKKYRKHIFSSNADAIKLFYVLLEWYFVYYYPRLNNDRFMCVVLKCLTMYSPGLATYVLFKWYCFTPVYLRSQFDYNTKTQFHCSCARNKSKPWGHDVLKIIHQSVCSIKIYKSLDTVRNNCTIVEIQNSVQFCLWTMLSKQKSLKYRTMLSC